MDYFRFDEILAAAEPGKQDLKRQLAQKLEVAS